MTVTHKYDVVIAGGGLVGNALALALAGENLRVAVVDPLAATTQLDAAFDGRTSAISLGSVRVLRAIGVWQFLAAAASPIHDIRVCDGYAPGYVHYAAKEVGEEPFGYILENRMLRHGLYEALARATNITRYSLRSVTGYVAESDSVTATLENGETLTGQLLVAADGRLSRLRDAAGMDYRVISYDQTAIVCAVTHANPHHGLALERFLPPGPFAVLPLADSVDGQHRSGIVWTEHDRDAPIFLALPEEEFNAELMRRMGAYWGETRVIGKRFSYPLKLMHATRFTAPRFALVGDAAHGIHPIAGQGVNLGYRDVAALTEILAGQHRQGGDLGAPEPLAHYERWRKFDSVSMTASTDLLNRLFSNRSPGLTFLRRSGLKMVEQMPPLKHFFMRHAMGLIGDLPKMMRSEVLPK
jgi:2-octaprenyl-6-methoxyphenol hydroxylase